MQTAAKTTRRTVSPNMRKLLAQHEVPEFSFSVDLPTPTELVVPSGSSQAGAWLAFGYRIFAWEQATPWAWGEWWLARGSRGLPADWPGPNRGTLDNRASVCRAFPPSRRRENVSFAHHQEVMGCSEAVQDELLDRCEPPHGLSVAMLRMEKQRYTVLKEKQRQASLPPQEVAPYTEAPAVEQSSPQEFVTLSAVPSPPATVVWVEGFPLDEGIHFLATETAKAAGLSLTEWIVDAIVEHIQRPTP